MVYPKPYPEKMIRSQIIWNLTRACPWSCPSCIVNAKKVSLDNLDKTYKEMIETGEELSLENKLKIVDNLDLPDIKVDLSGGDPLIFAENFEILRELSRKIGRNKVSITTTSKGLNFVNSKILIDIVEEIGFSYDFPKEPPPTRPLRVQF